MRSQTSCGSRGHSDIVVWVKVRTTACFHAPPINRALFRTGRTDLGTEGVAELRAHFSVSSVDT